MLSHVTEIFSRQANLKIERHREIMPQRKTEFDVSRYIPRKNETLSEELLRLAMLFRLVKPLNVDKATKKMIMTNPELLPQYLNQQHGDDIAV
jgi:hypothetical protein